MRVIAPHRTDIVLSGARLDHFEGSFHGATSGRRLNDSRVGYRMNLLVDRITRFYSTPSILKEHREKSILNYYAENCNGILVV